MNMITPYIGFALAAYLQPDHPYEALAIAFLAFVDWGVVRPR